MTELERNVVVSKFHFLSLCLKHYMTLRFHLVSDRVSVQHNRGNRNTLQEASLHNAFIMHAHALKNTCTQSPGHTALSLCYT